MAIVERPTALPELPPGAAVTARPLGVFTRPQATTGWRSWLTTIDHKRIGIMYGAASMFFFLLGGVEALFLRIDASHRLIGDTSPHFGCCMATKVAIWEPVD